MPSRKRGGHANGLGLGHGCFRPGVGYSSRDFFKLNLGDVLGVATTGLCAKWRNKRTSISRMIAMYFSSKLDPAKKAATGIRQLRQLGRKNEANFTTTISMASDISLPFS